MLFNHGANSGGILCESIELQPYIFCQSPFAIVAGVLCWKFLQQFETKTITKSRMDAVGLVLLVVWVAALQIMLDEGKGS